MNTHANTQIPQAVFTALGCLAILTISSACDSEQLDGTTITSSNVDEGVVNVEVPLISEQPDEIEGAGPMGFDEELQVYVYDRDDDGYSDLTEELEGTDMLDPHSNPADDLLAPTGEQAAAPGAIPFCLWHYWAEPCNKPAPDGPLCFYKQKCCYVGLHQLCEPPQPL